MSSEKLNRRQLARAAAWTTPVLFIGAAAPAIAASPVNCPSVPTPSSWSTSYSGTLGLASSGGYGWNSSTPYNFNEYRDNGSTSQTLTITTSTTITVTAGVTYNLSSQVFWGYGNGVAGSSTPQTVALSIGGSSVFSVATRSTALGASGSTTTVPGTYTATTTGSVTMTLTFTLSALTRAANDDVVVYMPSFTSCTQ